MEIGISNEMLRDIGLNLAGFLAAGGMLGIVYSLFFRRARTETVTEAKPALQPAAPPVVADRIAPKDEHLEFIDLKHMTWNTNTNSRTRTSRSAGRPARDRQDVLRLAKQLLTQKHEERELKQKLPITDAELAMTRRTVNLEGAGRSA
ncbi:MAG: hypothetical protein JW763_08575 [candidate division Zixibacteria bacterium]|nr:hypothetical protein [candidate division Zixibacteria bacterium]